MGVREWKASLLIFTHMNLFPVPVLNLFAVNIVLLVLALLSNFWSSICNTVTVIEINLSIPTTSQFFEHLLPTSNNILSPLGLLSDLNYLKLNLLNG